MKSRIKVGDDILTRHTPPLRGICTQILSKERDKEYQLSYNNDGEVRVVWLMRCEILPAGDGGKMGFAK